MAPKLLALWHDFYANYSHAVLGSGVPGADKKLVAQVRCALLSASTCVYIPCVLHAHLCTENYLNRCAVSASRVLSVAPP